MKITRTSGCASHSRRIGKLEPGTVVRTLHCLPDSSIADPFVIIDMRSYGTQLDEMGCYDKVGIVNLRNNKLSIVKPERAVIVIDDVEVCIP